MNIRTALYVSGLTLLLLTGCSNSTTRNDVGFAVVASEKKLPTNFSELSYKREEAPSYEYLVQIANSKDALTDLIQLTYEMPNIDQEKEDFLLISYYESGSCSTVIENIEYDNTENLNIMLKNLVGFCTADAMPRTNIIILDKEVSQSLTHASIYESETTTKVPIQK
ncbi:hypothetical protein SAMN05518871_10120 [Psychrobacillus sp. OK028]|uniref:hypothetical protein n=1 Tax=Psychrobacillus sp. OK028 TaxID=1884359 RepID=UPI00088CE5CE|nr:hypothetical protein [Psychrobacillus sp. OK028]SDM35481.1 hypothetical protein SAMN05518871_10120 [Psychrobacillus sp. OK028]